MLKRAFIPESLGRHVREAKVLVCAESTEIGDASRIDIIELRIGKRANGIPVHPDNPAVVRAASIAQGAPLVPASCETQYYSFALHWKSRRTAIDERILRETFQQWAELGGGQYVDARNAADLTAGLASSIEQSFQVLDAGGKVVGSGQANGVALELPPGDYHITAGSGKPIAVHIVPGEESVATLH